MDCKKDFHRDKLRLCFSEVPETTAAAWATDAELIRSMKVFLSVVLRLLNQMVSVREREIEEWNKVRR